MRWCQVAETLNDSCSLSRRAFILGLKCWRERRTRTGGLRLNYAPGFQSSLPVRALYCPALPENPQEIAVTKRKVVTYRKQASRMASFGAVRHDREPLSNPYQTRDLCPIDLCPTFARRGCDIPGFSFAALAMAWGIRMAEPVNLTSIMAEIET